MKHAICISLICLPLLVHTARAQEPQEASKPATKLDAFQARTGVVIVRGFAAVGTIAGTGNGTIAVDACEFKTANDPTLRTTGVRFAVKESLRLERENTVFIDSDEIDSLLAGIDYIAKASAAVTELNSFEVEYRTKGEFRIVVFNAPSGKLSAAVSAGRIGRTTVFLSMEQLQELRGLIIAAKGKVTGKVTGKRSQGPFE